MATPTVTVGKRPVTWMHLVTFAIVTGVCTVLAIFAVIAAPVPPAPGVSGLYIAAAVYVPVALWFGMWGALAGYVSCVLLGINTGMPILFVLWWSVADFFEGLVPLALFRLFNVDLDFKFQHRGTANTILLLLVVDLVVAALCTASPAVAGALGQVTLFGQKFGLLYLLSFLVAAGLMVATIVVTKSRAWTFYVLFGVLLCSIIAGLVGASVVALAEMSGGTTLALAIVGVAIVVVTTALAVIAQNNPKLNLALYIVILAAIVVGVVMAIATAGGNPAYGIVFFGWGFGDIVVLATIGSMLMTILTPFIKRTQVYIKGWIS